MSMLQKIKSILTGHFYFSNIDPMLLHKRIEILEQNNKVLQNYIISLARLAFLNPVVLDREIKNISANTEYLGQLITADHETHQETN